MEPVDESRALLHHERSGFKAIAFLAKSAKLAKTPRRPEPEPR